MVNASSLRALTGDKAPDVREALDRAKDRAHDFFRNVANNLPARSQQGAENRVRITAKVLEPFYEDAALRHERSRCARSNDCADQTAAAGSRQAQDGAKMDLMGFSRRAGELRDELRFILRANEPDYVYFHETRGRGLFLRAAPIDVSNILRDVLFDRMKATVLTSATLTVEGTFDYVRGRLGLEKTRSTQFVKLPQEFDYRQQAILYLPRKMPDPRSIDFNAAAAREIIGILEATRGRAFVLFTSYAALRAIQQIAEIELPYPILVQGSAPRTALLEQFRTTPNAVLLATSSFWQGVDVMGDALSCVIIDKLPFASPGDPITAARIEAIADRGGQPFGEYQVPLAILTLLQGLGRLIRHRDDRGVLAVLDPRLQTMGYGRRFLASMPPAGSPGMSRTSRGFSPADRGREPFV